MSIFCFARMCSSTSPEGSAVQAMADALRPGGRVTLLVPAHPRLYGNLDRVYGHHRRYTREHSPRVITETWPGNSGPILVNLLGVLGWWLNRFRRSPGISLCLATGLRGVITPVGADRASATTALGSQPSRPRAEADPNSDARPALQGSPCSSSDIVVEVPKMRHFFGHICLRGRFLRIWLCLLQVTSSARPSAESLHESGDSSRQS